MEYNLQILQISDYKYTQSKQVTVKITIQLRNSSKKKKKKRFFWTMQVMTLYQVISNICVTSSKQLIKLSCRQ